MPPLRILHVIDSLPLGGAEQLLVTLARCIDRVAYDLRVCSLHGLDETSPVVHALRTLGVPVYAPRAKRQHDPRHVAELTALIWRQQIDVVHTHLPYASSVGIVAARLARRPVVATLHSIRDAHKTRGSYKHALTATALRWGADAIIACAPEVAGEALTRLRLPTHRVCIVPNGIDVRPFLEVSREQARRTRHELLGGYAGPLVVSVGNLRPAKGHEYLVNATASLVGEYPHARVALVGAGGPNEPVVRARLAALGLHERVVLVGPRSDIPHVLAAADVVVQPSLWEGLPLSLLEAMAAGRPVVATAVGGVPGVLRDGQEGRLVPAGNAEALAQAIRQVLRDPQAACKLGMAARERVQANYGADAWARRLQLIYSRLAS